MAARKSGLGRGLDSLLPVEHPLAGFSTIKLDEIKPNPQQPREHFDPEALQSLADSIAEVGVLQPIVVRPAEEGYVLIAGERRCRAARIAELTEIPAIIRSETGEESASLAEALIENVQREDLSPLEEAAGYQQLLTDFGLTHEEVATKVGKSRSAITNTLRLLQLPAPIQGMVGRGDLSAGHARALLAIEDVPYAVHIAERVVAEGWSVRQVEDAVKKRAGTAATTKSARVKPPRPAAIIELEDRLGERLGTAVRIDHGKRGGKVAIKYSSLDDLERIYRLLS
ncbi:MAG: ParB/RepB/Spo0J family partition protein [Acidimicrobiia bacterium]|nr:ParB/RepB/Spo0J family partition protein [Acidimicrobiia bacterium]